MGNHGLASGAKSGATTAVWGLDLLAITAGVASAPCAPHVARIKPAMDKAILSHEDVLVISGLSSVGKHSDLRQIILHFLLNT